MFKHDIFGGKPISAYQNDGTSRRSTTTQATAAFVKAFRTGTKEQMLDAFNPIWNYSQVPAGRGTQPSSAEYKAVLSTLSNAWNKVVYSFFHAKQRKNVDMGEGHSKGTSTVLKEYVDRKGHKHKLDSVQYFRKRHPKLFNAYLKAFEEYLNKSPAQGGVVVTYDDNVRNKAAKYGIVHYKKIAKYSRNQANHILSFLKEAHYDGANLRGKVDYRSSQLGQNRVKYPTLYATDVNGYSVMTLYAMYRKLSKKNNKNEQERQMLQALSGVFGNIPVPQRPKVKGKGYSKDEKLRLDEQYKALKEAQKQALIGLGGINGRGIRKLAADVYALVQESRDAKDAAKYASKVASHDRFVELVDRAGLGNTNYGKGVLGRTNLSTDERKFMNGMILSLRSRGVNVTGKNFDQIAQALHSKTAVSVNKRVARRTKVSQIKRGKNPPAPPLAAQGGSLSSSRLSSMSSSSMSSFRDNSSFTDGSEFTF